MAIKSKYLCVDNDDVMACGECRGVRCANNRVEPTLGTRRLHPSYKRNNVKNLVQSIHTN